MNVDFSFPITSFFVTFISFFIIVIIISILTQLFKSPDNKNNRTGTDSIRQNRKEHNFTNPMNMNSMMSHDPTDMNRNGIPDSLEMYTIDSDHDGIPDFLDKHPYSYDNESRYNSDSQDYSGYIEPDHNAFGSSDIDNGSSSHFGFNPDSNSFSQGSGDIGSMDSGGSDNFNNSSF